MQWKDLPEDQRQLARDYNRARKERIAAWGTKDKEQIEKVGDAHEDSLLDGAAMTLPARPGSPKPAGQVPYQVLLINRLSLLAPRNRLNFLPHL
jgi:hypothetical protein